MRCGWNGVSVTRIMSKGQDSQNAMDADSRGKLGTKSVMAFRASKDIPKLYPKIRS